MIVEFLFTERTLSTYLSIGSSASFTYLIFKCFYNLYLHSLSRFSGPKIAVMGGMYEFWYDVIKDCTYLWEIEKMHERYGPIVRINVTEIHIRDSQYYSTNLHGRSREGNKDPATVRAFAVPSSVATTVDHSHHRARRGYLNPYFSKNSIIGMEPMIHKRIGKLCERLKTSRAKGKVLTLNSAFSALTADIITKRCFSENFNYLSIPNYKMAVTEAFLGVSFVFHLARFIPGLVSTLKMMRIPVIRMIFPPAANLLVLQEEIRQKILASLDEKGKEESKSVIVSTLGDITIPAPERQIDRLLDEGTVITFAGTETSSRALSIGMFYLLNNETHLIRLREELKSLPFKLDNDYSMSQLEPLPFLRGVVHESLRISFGAVSRLPRVVTQEAPQYQDITIPPGTPVSQSTYFVHTDATVYPDPPEFDPDRWTQAAQEGFALEQIPSQLFKRQQTMYWSANGIYRVILDNS